MSDKISLFHGAVWYFVFLFSTTVHEASHALAASTLEPAVSSRKTCPMSITRTSFRLSLRLLAPKRATWCLARSIARKGIKPKPFMQPAFEGNRARVVSLFGKIGVAVVQRMAG